VSFFLGIDAGGTKTECVLADSSGAILGRGTGGPANLQRTPLPRLEQSLREAYESALSSADRRAGEFAAVCAGFAGAGRTEARETARHLLAQLIPTQQLFVVGDMEVALEAAVGAGCGVILIAGTGSIAYGRNHLGQQARAGGLGPVLGDVGSAFDIGRRALEAALRARDDCRPTTLLDPALRTHFLLNGASQLAALLAGREAPERVASLLPVVVRIAEQGDSVAQEILLAAGDALAELAVSVLRALRLETTPALVVMSGGVFSSSPQVATQVRRRLQELVPAAEVKPLTISPAEGAVRLAQRLWLQGRTAAPIAQR